MSASKRLADIVIAGVALLVLWPVLAIAALLVWRQDYHSPIFAQQRVGYGGRLFRLFKLRTMIVGAESKGSPTARTGDPRITRLGAVLRRTKIDELPQLVNVLRGDMSIVGPRPTLELVVNRYSPADSVRVFSVRPGITGISSIVFSDLDDMMKKSAKPEEDYFREVFPWICRFECEYVAKQSLLLDAALVLLTAANIVNRPAALTWLGSLLERIGAPAEMVNAVLRRREAAMGAAADAART